MKNITKINIAKMVLIYIKLSIIGYNRKGKLKFLYFDTVALVCRHTN